ncbi:hypothetical protein PUN28_011646 [Cardiocondyla obscurior]|uniref:Uncharacterized protein n=1 Tax=Cardiocondyla obscurior TaxID=286306 RepID=A0AAW2FIN1_9HYME
MREINIGAIRILRRRIISRTDVSRLQTRRERRKKRRRGRAGAAEEEKAEVEVQEERERHRGNFRIFPCFTKCSGSPFPPPFVLPHLVPLPSTAPLFPFSPPSLIGSLFLLLFFVLLMSSLSELPPHHPFLVSPVMRCGMRNVL